MTRLVLVTIAALLCGACRPPQAPTELDDLCVYLFAEHPHDQPAWMEVGLVSLQTWLQENPGETEEGYEVSGLTDEAVDALDGEDRRVDGILGVAVATESAFTVQELQEGVLVADATEVAPDNYLAFERAYLTDLDCFLDRSCDRLETTEDVESSLAFGVTSAMLTWNQYLWVETDSEPALVQRSWLPDPPDVNVEWLAVAEQYYVNVFVPREGGSWRLQTTWLVNDQDVISEAGLLNTVVRGMEDNAANLEAWLVDAR
jgi:hypothetical protein